MAADAWMLRALRLWAKDKMFGRREARTLCQEILRRSRDTAAEVFLHFKSQALTRFANNCVHQNVAERNATVMVRLLRERRLGLAATSRLDGEGLDRVVQAAAANARAAPPDPDYPGLPEPGTYAAVECFDPETASCSPERRASGVREICSQAAAKGLKASGAFSTGTCEVAVANSIGLFAYHPITRVDFQTVVLAPDASGHAHGSALRLQDVALESLGTEAIQKAEAGRSPRKIEPGEFTVVLEPYASADLVLMLSYYGAGAQAVLEGRSWMKDRLGKRLMSELISIWDDGLDPAGMPVPFDCEGVPKQRVDIVREGVVQGPVHDRITARKMGQKSTGHAPPPSSRSLGPMATNLFMAAGTASLAEMIGSTDNGLYITRFWYTRLVHPRDCLVTGMTRDGVFKIEKGEVAYAVKDLRFTHSYVEALARAVITGGESRLLLGGFGECAVRVPALKIDGFRFTGTTV